MTAVDIEFVVPLAGLSPRTAFRLDPIEGAEGLYALRSVVDDVRLFLLDPVTVHDDYRPPLTDAHRAEIGASNDSEVGVLVVANPADDGVYTNLRAPILIHRTTGRATQIILEEQAYPIRSLVTARAGA